MVSASSGYLPESWCNSGGGPTALGEKAESWATAIVQATQEHMAVVDG